MAGEQYRLFAHYYDLLMHDAPYDAWESFFQRQIQNRADVVQPRGARLADIGCGTGTLTMFFCEEGFEVIGVDLSEHMLAQAAAKLADKVGVSRYQLVQQDVRELNLPKPVDIAVSFCDTLSYLLTEEDLLLAFRAVRGALCAGGLFMFDLQSPYKLEEELGNGVFCDVQDKIAYIWETQWNEDHAVCESNVTFFAELPNGLYQRFTEIHRQKAYAAPVVVNLLRLAGFHHIQTFSDFSDAPVNEQTSRIFFVCQSEQG